VHGKKKAKEECARRAVEYLEEVYKKRVEASMGLLEGEGESGVGKEGDEKREGEESDGEEGFEDAVEEMET
jgi:hypothetical protein